MSSEQEWMSQLSQLAEEAGDLAVRMRAESITSKFKIDGSVVTSADQALEELIRSRLPSITAKTGIWGEEIGWEAPQENGLWLVDPIDGTSNFAFGSPHWGVSIALIQGEELVGGVVRLPDLHETYVGRKGFGVTLNGKSLEPIPEGEIESHETVAYCEAVTKAAPGVNWPGKQRCAGAFVIDGAFVAAQRIRGMVGVREKLYDMAACTFFALELGADTRYADGSPMSFEELSVDRKIDRPWVIFPKNCSFRI